MLQSCMPHVYLYRLNRSARAAPSRSTPWAAWLAGTALTVALVIIALPVLAVALVVGLVGLILFAGIVLFFRLWNACRSIGRNPKRRNVVVLDPNTGRPLG